MRVLTTKYVFAEDHPQIYSHTAMSWVMCGNDQKHLLKHRYVSADPIPDENIIDVFFGG